MHAAPPFDPRADHVRRDPYPVYEELRSAEPVQLVPTAGTWFVSAHRECVEVLSDARFSAEKGQSLRLRTSPLPTTMLNADGQEHTRLRAAVSEAFGPVALARARTWLEPAVADAVARFLAAVDSGRAVDVVSEAAEPLAVSVLGRFLGVEDHDLASLASWGRAVAVNLDPFADPSSADGSADAMQAMLGRFADLLHTPSDPHGALAVLARSHASGLLSPAEALATAGLLMVGGLEPIVAMLSNATAALLTHPHRRGMGETPAKTVVQELLRFDPPIQFTARMATADVMLGGRRISSGEHVVVLLGAANRDPARFETPGHIVLDRWRNPHLSFGAGAHRCVGAPLVRLLGELVVEALRPAPPPVSLVSADLAPAVVPRAHRSLVLRRSGHP